MKFGPCKNVSSACDAVTQSDFTAAGQTADALSDRNQPVLLCLFQEPELCRTGRQEGHEGVREPHRLAGLLHPGGHRRPQDGRQGERKTMSGVYHRDLLQSGLIHACEFLRLQEFIAAEKVIIIYDVIHAAFSTNII